MVRVDIIQEYVPSYREPLFRQMKDLASRRGIEIRVIAGRPNGSQAQRDDATTDVVDLRIEQREISVGGKRINFRKTSAATARSELVIFEQARRNIDTYLALAFPQQRIALWGHGSDHVKTAGRVDRALLKLITNRADWFFGYTPQSVADVVSGGFAPEKTTILWNSTDTRNLRASMRAVSEGALDKLRTELDLRGQTALYIGGLDESKRLPFLVRSCDLVAARNSDFRLVMVGTGSQKDYLTRASSTRTWLKTVGAQQGPALAPFLLAADLLTIPGRVGLVAVDSLVAGLPLVTTDWPHHAPERSYLDESNSVTTVNDEAAYAQALIDVLENDHMRRALIRGCLAAAPNFSVERMAERFVAGIEFALAQ